jgi:mRNA-degrading endonuclease RelE of RelBE toxin-antitoxin system
VKPYEIRLTKEAVKDIAKLTPKLKIKLQDMLLNTVALDPVHGKRLVGDLEGFYSLRLTFKGRIVYSVDETTHTVFVHRTRTHYGECSRPFAAPKARRMTPATPLISRMDFREQTTKDN